MPSQADTAKKDAVRFKHRVLAVFPRQPSPSNSDKNESQPSFGSVHQFFILDVNYDPSASVLFRFSLSGSQGVPFYLQIFPDRIASLSRTVDDVDRNQELDTVSRELGGIRRLLCLRFRLYKPGHLIAPIGFEINSSDAETSYNFKSINSLALSLDFSVYLRPHDLTKSKFATFQEAIGQDRTTAQVAALEWRADPSRLYNGKGGVVLIPGNEPTSSQVSCAPTLAVDTPPGYSVGSDDAESPTLPTYQQAYQNVASPIQELGKRHRSSHGSADSRPPKRTGPMSIATDNVSPESCGKCTSRNTGNHRDMLEPHTHCGHDYSRIDNLERIVGALMAKNEQLEARLSQQQLDIQGLIAKNEELEARFFKQQSETQSLTGSANKLYDKDNHLIYLDNLAERQDELERRQEECEESKGMLQQRQETMEESIEAIDVRVTELDGLLDDDWKLQLFDEIRGESVAGVKEFLRNI